MLMLGICSLLPPSTSRPCHRRRAHIVAVDAAEDWRDVRAKLVASERGETPASGAVESSYLFESPLIEQGTVLLDQDTAVFALHQQYFHKSLCLLLEHGDGYTKGVLLNRPSGLTIDGWRAWFGGDVATGGFFGSRADAAEDILDDGGGNLPREVTCLHALEGEEAC